MLFLIKSGYNKDYEGSEYLTLIQANQKHNGSLWKIIRSLWKVIRNLWKKYNQMSSKTKYKDKK